MVTQASTSGSLSDHPTALVRESLPLRVPILTATPLRAAVIGTGLISKEHLGFLSQSSRAHLVATCDLSPISAKYAAQRYNAAGFYTDYRELLATAKPEVVHILTPPNTHTWLAKACLEAGSHVICEKPITLSHQDLQELQAIAKAHDRYLIEDHNYRFNPTILAIDDLIAAGHLGDIQEVEVRMALDIRSGGAFADENLPNPVHQLPAGVIHDVITHLVYLILHYLPFEIKNTTQVKAAWHNHGGGTLFKYDDLDAIIINDTNHARIRFSAHLAPPCFEVTVRGTRGWAQTDLFQPYLRTVIPRRAGKQLSPIANHWLNGWDLVRSSVRNFKWKLMQRTPYEGLHRLLDSTYIALQQGTPPPISDVDMERTSQLIEVLLQEKNSI